MIMNILHHYRHHNNMDIIKVVVVYMADAVVMDIIKDVVVVDIIIQVDIIQVVAVIFLDVVVVVAAAAGDFMMSTLHSSCNNGIRMIMYIIGIMVTMVTVLIMEIMIMVMVLVNIRNMTRVILPVSEARIKMIVVVVDVSESRGEARKSANGITAKKMAVARGVAATRIIRMNLRHHRPARHIKAASLIEKKIGRGVRIVIVIVIAIAWDLQEEAVRRGERRKIKMKAVNVRVEIAIMKEIILPIVTLGEAGTKTSVHRVAEVSVAVEMMIVLLVVVQAAREVIMKAGGRRNVSAMIFIMITMIVYILPRLQIMEVLHPEGAIWGEVRPQVEVIWVGVAAVVAAVDDFMMLEEEDEAEAGDLLLVGAVGAKTLYKHQLHFLRAFLRNLFCQHCIEVRIAS
mmetsp:Transcript_22590/g.34701  ORF Transcript_22590/g.34701 Transcript_22590/m.34701 type:complete len:400 (-) Transcript_22590:192-1391(-)